MKHTGFLYTISVVYNGIQPYKYEKKGGTYMKEWNGKPVKKWNSAMDQNGNKVGKIFYEDGTTEIVRGGNAAQLPHGGCPAAAPAAHIAVRARNSC